MLPEIGCLSEAYPNYQNLLSLQNWPGNFCRFTGPDLEACKDGLS